MTDNKYNGWSNYATWRFNLEIVDGIQWSSEDTTFKDIYSLSEYIKDTVEEIVYGYDEDNKGLAYDYAMAFISDVNYYEIAQKLAIFMIYPITFIKIDWKGI